MMKNRSLVSIVVPIYNGEKWLNKAVDSAINQSYKNIEILLNQIKQLLMLKLYIHMMW